MESLSNVLFGAVVEDIETIVNGSRLGIWWDDDHKYRPCTVQKITKEEERHELFVQYDDGDDECLDISLETVCWIGRSNEGFATTTNDVFAAVATDAVVATTNVDMEGDAAATDLNSAIAGTEKQKLVPAPAFGNEKRKAAPLSTTTAPESSKSMRFTSDSSAMFPHGVSEKDIAWANNNQKFNERRHRKEYKKSQRDELNPHRTIKVRFIGPLDADATAKEANKKKEYDRIYYQQNKSKISAQRKNRYQSKKNKTKIVPALVSSMIPAKKVRSKMTTHELWIKMYRPLLTPLLSSLSDGTIFHAICPLNNNARLNYNSTQALRLFCGKDKPHRTDNNLVYRPHYGEVGIMQSMGYDPEDFRVLPMSQDIDNFVENILTPKIRNHLGEKWADIKLEFNSLEYKVYLGSDMFLDKDKTPLKLQPGSTKQKRRNNSEIGFHNDFQFCVDGKQKKNDSANGEMPVVTVTLFDDRELTYKWKRSKTGKKFVDVPNVKITITLVDASFNILLPFDEIPQSMGDYFFKTQHSAKYKGKGLSIACVFRGVKKWSAFNKITNLLIPERTKSLSKIAEIQKLKTTEVDKYNQKMIAQNIRNYVNNNIK